MTKKQNAMQMAESKVARCEYYRVEGTTATICALVTASGFVSIGQSGSVRPEDFDETLGQDIARGKALVALADHCAFLLSDQNAGEGAQQ